MTTPRHGVHAASELHRSIRRTSRQVARLNQALDALREGPSLHFNIAPPDRLLNDGRPVPAEVARLVISNTSVEPADGALFRGMPAQTWRYSQ